MQKNPVPVKLVIRRQWTETYPDPKATELHKASCRLFQSLVTLYDIQVTDWGGANKEDEVHEEITPSGLININADKVIAGIVDLFKSLVDRNKLKDVDIEVGEVKIRVRSATIKQIKGLMKEVKSLMK